jgi:chromosome segregation ATPase
LSSWKNSFETISQELEMARRKKRALEDLLAKNRMSRPTYEHLLKGIEDEIVRLEDHRRSLARNMTERAEELQRQISLIEMFLASLELRHIGQEIDESSYKQQKEALAAGLEATKEELKVIQKALAEIGK